MAWVATVSDKTVWRWLHEDAIRPWQHRTWIFPRDPDFARKAGRFLDLYARCWNGQPLTADDFVISADEKPSIQVRLRRHPSTPPRARHPMRVEREYTRSGAWASLAALDVHRAKLFGRCESTTGIAPFHRLVTQVMTQSPYRRPTSLLDCRQRVLAPGRGLRPPPPDGISQSGPRARSDSCELARPNRNLLLDRATQGPDAQ